MTIQKFESYSKLHKRTASHRVVVLKVLHSSPPHSPYPTPTPQLLLLNSTHQPRSYLGKEVNESHKALMLHVKEQAGFLKSIASTLWWSFLYG